MSSSDQNPDVPVQQHALGGPVVSDADTQTAVWFLGALVRERLTGAASGDQLAVLEHVGGRGYNSPMHRHQRDDETFLVLDGRIEFTSGDSELTVEAGSAVFLPRRQVHGFVVASAGAKFLTLHTPAGFERFIAEVGASADIATATTTDADTGERAIHMPADTPMPSPEELTRVAATYGIEIVGPPPAIR